jgi:hypothetical protein
MDGLAIVGRRGGQACLVSFCLTGLGAWTVERKVGGRFGLLTVIDTDGRKLTHSHEGRSQ